MGPSRRFRVQIREHSKAAVVAASAVAVVSAGTALAVSVGSASGSATSATPARHHSAHRLAGGTLAITQLPARPELGEWTPTQGDGPVLVCVPEDVMSSLAPQATQTAEFVAFGAHSPARGPFKAQIAEQVLTFGDDAAASDAMQSVASWVHDCAARDLVRPGSVESETVSGSGHGFWETYLRSARAICTECDAVYFDRQAVVQSGNQLVLISLNEVGGPLEPDGLTATMRSLVHAAVTTAARA